MTIDLHIHTTFSDGVFPAEQIVEMAAARNFTAVGISDHFNTRKTESILPEEIDEYLDTLTRLESAFDSRINVLKGLEIDTLDMILTRQSILDHPWIHRLDYLLFEYISNRPPAGVPLEFLLKLRKLIPIPVGLAHTDILQAFPGTPTEVILEKLADAKIFLELNESYHRQDEFQPFYRHLEPFKETIRSSGIMLTTGSDTHRSLDGFGCDHAQRFIDRCGLAAQLHPMIHRTGHSGETI